MTERPLEQTADAPHPAPTADAGGDLGTEPPRDPTSERELQPQSQPQPQPQSQPTGPVTRPVPGPQQLRGASVQQRIPRVRMGPWAPVAGAVLGLVVGLLVTLLGLAPVSLTFTDRLAAVFLCLGLTLLGAGGVLFADEVRARRRSVSARSAEAVAGLLNGLTPARFLVGSAGFVLLLTAYVSR